MSFKKAEKQETNVYVIEFQIEKADFDAANDKAFRRNAKNINIPGFRKGKAPRNIVEKMYGKGVFYEEAVNILLPHMRMPQKPPALRSSASPNLTL